MLRGRSEWDDKLSSSNNNDISIPRWEHIGNQTDEYQNGAVFLTCPKCEKVVTPNALRNSAKNLDHHLKCKHCNKTVGTPNLMFNGQTSDHGRAEVARLFKGCAPRASSMDFPIGSVKHALSTLLPSPGVAKLASHRLAFYD